MKKQMLLRKTLIIVLTFTLLLPVGNLFTIAKGTDEGYTVNVNKTEIRADYVMNTDGYASIKLTPDIEEYWDPYKQPENAVYSMTGEEIIPYTEGEFWYIVSDNTITSETEDNDIIFGSIPYAGYYNLNGEKLFESDYQFEKHFNNGIALVRSGQSITMDKHEYTVNTYLINKAGEVVLDLGYNFNQLGGYFDSIYGPASVSLGICGNYSEGLLPFGHPEILNENITIPINWPLSKRTMPGRPIYGFSDIKGNIVIPQKYVNCLPFSEGVAAVQDADIRYYYYDNDPVYVDIPTVEGKTTYSEITAKKWGYIDKENHIEIPFIYDTAESFQNGYAVVSKDGKYGIINRKNETVVPFEYDSIYSSIENGLFVCEDESGVRIKTFKGDVIFSLKKEEYSDYSDYRNGVFYYIKDQKLNIVTIQPPVLLGDITGDGAVMPEDARLALRASVRLESYKVGSREYLAADVTGNGIIGSDDARYILRASVGLEDLNSLRKK